MMDRRDFSRTMASALGLSALGPRALHGAFLQPRPVINAPRLQGWLRDMSQLGAREDGGVDRVAFSDADVEGRAFVRSLMEEACLQVRVDLAESVLQVEVFRMRFESMRPSSRFFIRILHVSLKRVERMCVSNGVIDRVLLPGSPGAGRSPTVRPG